MKIGVFPGKFLPLHRGHIMAILNASTMCDKLYIVVCHNSKEVKNLCANIKPIDLKTRLKWLSLEFQNFDHIQVTSLNEDIFNIKPFPDGWEKWAKTLINVIPEKIDIIFGNEPSYIESHNKYFPSYIEYKILDSDRIFFNISGTEIRNNPIKNWEYLSGASREYFCKKILITGTESCGKTTLTKMLAKFYYTSWSEEVGRFYSQKFLGGNESTFIEKDFERIAFLQQEQNIVAHKTANKICFEDTDAIITQYYLEQYGASNIKNKIIELISKEQTYDTIFILKPDVPWIDDGLRFLSDQNIRNKNHELLLNTYKQEKPNTPIYEISGNYNQRLNNILNKINDIFFN